MFISQVCFPRDQRYEASFVYFTGHPECFPWWSVKIFIFIRLFYYWVLCATHFFKVKLPHPITKQYKNEKHFITKAKSVKHGTSCSTSHKGWNNLNNTKRNLWNRKEKKKKTSWPKPQTSLMAQWIRIIAQFRGQGLVWDPHAMEQLKLGPSTAEAQALETLCNK